MPHMPHLFGKKSSKDNAKDAGDAPGRTSKMASHKGKSLADSDAELTPKDDGGKKHGGALASLKSAIGLGKKDKDKEKTKQPMSLATDEQVAVFDKVMKSFVGVLPSVANLGNRCLTLASEGKNDATPELLARLEHVAGLCSGFERAFEVARAEGKEFDMWRVVEPMQAALRRAESMLAQIKIELYGHATAGDSCGAASMMLELMSADGVVDGFQLGKKEKAQGKKNPGPSEKPMDVASEGILPMAGSGWALMARAIREYAASFCEKYDAFAPYRGTI